MKTCYVCKVEKPLEDFHRNKSSKDGRQNRCGACATEKNIERYHRERVRLISYQKDYDSRPSVKFQSKIKRIARIYGVSEQEAISLANVKVCEICGREGLRMHIDHCHDTGRVRGVLCSNCNMSIGGFQESIESLKKAIAYLENR